MNAQIMVTLVVSACVGLGCDNSEGDTGAKAEAKSAPAKADDNSKPGPRASRPASADADEPAATPKAEAEAATAPKGPCDRLTEATVRKHFEVGDDVKLEPRLVDARCVYEWRKPDADERRKRMVEQRRAALGKTAKGDTPGALLGAAMFAIDNEVELEIDGTKLDSPARAKQRLDSLMEGLNKGLTAKGGTMTLASEPTSGVGDAAYWAADVGRLSFVSGTQLFHLRVQVHDKGEDNLTDAKALAAIVLSQ